LFTTSDLGGFLMKQVDLDGRPVYIADSGALLAAEPAGDPTNAGGWLGVHFLGLAAYTDDNVGYSTSTQQQIIVAQMPEVIVLRSPSYTFSFVETEAAELSVVVGLRQYAASTPRYSGAVVQITGSGYSGLTP